MNEATDGVLSAASIDVFSDARAASTEPVVTRANEVPAFSIVVPVCNERAVLLELYRRVRAVMDQAMMGRISGQMSEDWELMLVDDGSRDQSAEVMAFLCAQDSRVRGIRLTRNFGFQVAATAGLDAARGRAVILMDADLQDPPEVIPELVSQWRAGFDVVYGVRSEREGESWFKRASASGFYRLIGRITNVNIPPDTGDFRLMDRRVVDAIRQMPERHRFLRGMVSWVGFQQTGVRYKRQPRYAGETKFTLRKMLHFALDAITGFSSMPLQLASFFGFASVLLSGLALVTVIALSLSGAAQAWLGQLTTMAAVLFIGGVQLICTGIVGEYLGRMYDEMKQRPLYLIDQRWGFSEQTKQGGDFANTP
jgi:dolichol-phosphate mannosyltransferase